MKTKALTFVFTLFLFKGVSSVEKGHRVSSSLALGICSHVDLYQSSGDDSNPTVTKPTTPIGNGSFKRTECNDASCNAFSFSQIKGRSSKFRGAVSQEAKDFKEEEIGPQSQFNFRTTEVLGIGDTLYVHVTFPAVAWPIAMYACASNGMVLADINNATHKSQLQALLLRSSSESQRADVWIGGSRYTDDDKLKKWNWFASGIEVGKFLWAPPPGGTGGPPEKPQNFCLVLSNTEGKGTFYSYEHDCKDKFTYLCRTLL